MSGSPEQTHIAGAVTGSITLAATMTFVRGRALRRSHPELFATIAPESIRYRHGTTGIAIGSLSGP